MEIKVIKYKGGYVQWFGYSQGQLDEEITNNPLQALDLLTTTLNAEFAQNCYEKRGGVVETYEVTLTKK